MTANILHTIYLSGAFLILFASAEILFHYFNVKAEITRKYVHFSTGILAMLFPFLLDSHWFVLLLCGSFLVILLASLKWNFLRSINGVERETRGSILFPIIVYGCFLVFEHHDKFIFFYLPILILTICDPAAALVGKRWPLGPYKTFGHKKTMAGSLAFFITALVACLALMIMVDDIGLSQAIFPSILVALVTVTAEALTHKGYDNLTIPGSTVLTLILLSHLNFLNV